MNYYSNTKSETCSLKGHIEDFINEYSTIYFWQNRQDYEKVIDSIQNTDKNKVITNRTNLINIMAWKMGLLNRFGDENITVRTDSIIEDDEGTKLKGRVIVNIDELLNTVKEINFDNDLKEVLKELETVQGIGPVYAITILHFVDREKWPIYDRFADIALKAIEDDCSPWSEINELQLVSDSSSLNTQVTLYEKYKKRLNDVFGKEYDYRKVDQALWVYGHMFKKK